MIAHVFDPGDPIMIIGFIAVLIFVKDKNCIHKRAAALISSFANRNEFEWTLNSRMLTTISITPVAAAVHLEKRLMERKILQSYSKAASYLFHEFTNSRAIVAVDAIMMLYTKSVSVTLVPYVEALRIE